MIHYIDWIHDNILDKNIKNIGLELSGGTDSACALYLLSQFFIQNKTSHRILPIHGYDESRKHAYSVSAARDVIDVIKKRIPNAPIDDMFIFAYHREINEEKITKYHRPMIRFLLRDKRIDIHILGSTLEPEKKVLEENNMESIGRTPSLQRSQMGPFGLYRKRDIAILYQENDLMKDLFPVTISCVGDRKDLQPCKECWWCKEKYDAFGMYDKEHV